MDIILIKALILLPFLMYASYTDVRYRTIKYFVSLFLILSGILWLIYDIRSYGIMITTAPLFIMLFSFLLYHFKLFEWADAKIVIGLSLYFPNIIFIISVLFVVGLLALPVFVTACIRKTMFRESIPYIFYLSVSLYLCLILSCIRGDY